MNNSHSAASIGGGPRRPRRSPGLLALAGALFFASAGVSATAALPVPPQALLDALPEPPSGWELKVSRGRASLELEKGSSQAERTYVAGEEVRAKAARLEAQGESPAGPLDVQTQVVDTVHNTLAKIPFARWTEEGVASGKIRYLRLSGHRAIATLSNDGKLKISMLVSNRFVITSEFSPSATIEQALPWVAGIDASKLTGYLFPDNFKIEEKEKISVATDELNPFEVFVMSNPNSKPEKVIKTTRVYRSTPVGQSEEMSQEIRDAIARGEMPGEPTEEELKELEAVRKRLEGGGQYSPENDLKIMEERGLVPPTQPGKESKE